MSLIGSYLVDDRKEIEILEEDNESLSSSKISDNIKKKATSSKSNSKSVSFETIKNKPAVKKV